MFDEQVFSEKVAIQLYGGLGNQLFQYFALMHICRLNEQQPALLFEWIDKYSPHSGSDIRDFSFISQDLALTNSKIRYPEKILNLQNKLAKFMIIRRAGLRLRIIENLGFEAPQNFKPNNLYIGYFQSYRYLESTSKTHWDLKFPSTKFLSEKIRLSKTDFISLHVRAGDYLSSSEYITLSEHYYKTSMEEANRQFPGCQLIVFSDDTNFAKNLLSNLTKAEFFDDSELRASEIILLMALAKCVITANSTFSYWAGVIGESFGSSVISPESWFTDKVLPEDFFPSSWKLVKV